MLRGATRHRPCPALGRHGGNARIAQHMRDTIAVKPDRDDPARIARRAVLESPRRWIDADHDAHQIVGHTAPARFQQRARPQGAGQILDHLAVQFLPAQRRAGIGLFDMIDEHLRQERIVACRPARFDQPLRSQHALHQIGRSRRRRHQHARIGAAPEAHHQIVPRRIAAPPLGQLVAPRRAMLRPPQLLGRIGRIDIGDCPIGPAHLALVDRITWDPPRLGDRAQPARPVDHHPPHVRLGRADQRDRRILVRRQRRHPFRARTRLAESAPGADQPDAPVPLRRRLP